MQREGMAHLPVLVDEVTFLLRPRRGGWGVDGTVGMGGHAERLLERAGPRARLLGLDHDPEALARARQRLSRFGDRGVLTQGSFRDPAPWTPPREGGRAPILCGSGDKPQPRRIARRIVEQRARAPFATTADLVAVVKRSVPRAAWSRRTHVATRTFQALRMAVNDEPGALREALPQAAALLALGGRLGVISFHPGEDRMVKRIFRSLEPTRFGELEPSPIEPDPDEVRHNPRARSAKLRVLARLEAA